ncbi:MAG: bifunctional uridylate/adenylate kinase [Sarea resinae]|nr:MAG: bifunctional uridylate/adenylate kinase [Sarea resinae]
MSLPQSPLRLFRASRKLLAAIPQQSRAALRSTPTASSSPFQRHAQHSFRRAYATGPNPTPGQSPLKVWPFVAITLAGGGAYVLLVNSRAKNTTDDMPAIETSPQTTRGLPAPSKSTPTFSPTSTNVIFVLGGPGAGKGTQCANLVRDYGFKHLSAGDLLRAEQERPGSQFGGLIKEYIRDGKIVPMEVTVQLLENAMTETIKTEGKRKFLIDGFPRKMDQAVHFESAVCPSKFTLFFDCPEEVMEARLLNRGKTSGRSDDNPDSIRKRFRTFIDTSMPVVDYFDKEGKVVKIPATKGPDDVYADVKKALADRGFATDK